MEGAVTYTSSPIIPKDFIPAKQAKQNKKSKAKQGKR
jgi:hypothetical protein